MEIFGEYDVVVVGGGVSGCSAAIASARAGVRTVLIEKMGTLGSMMNVSGPPGWSFSHLWNNRGETIIAGIVEETHHRLEKEGHALPYPAPKNRHFNAYAFVDPDWWGLLVFEMLKESKVDLLLHSLAVDALKEGDTVKGVFVENTSGRMAVMGKVIIECTGEGDIAARAGVPFTKIDRQDREIDPPSITFHMDGVYWDKVTAYMRTHPDDLTRAKLAGGRTTTPEQQARNRKIIEQLEKSGSILDLVRAGMIGAIDFNEITL
jgi:hypothetical protein